MESRNNRKIRIGMVVSDKMQKTRVIRLDRRFQHPMYKKMVNASTRVKIHDEKNECKIGDIVEIRETRPLSKEKRWCLVKIIERAK